MRPALLILPGVLAVAVSYGLARYTYGLFVPDIRNDLGLSMRMLGLIASGSYAGFLGASAVTLVFAARTGPRLPVVVGCCFAAAGMLLISVSSGPWLLAAGVVLAGTSPGFAYTPFSDAVVRLIPEHKQERTYAVINSGTSFGVALAGPVAVWAGSSWREAWAVFAVLALVAAAWNGWLLPSGRHETASTERGGRAGLSDGASLPALRPGWFLRFGSVRLFAAASVIGVTTSAYWTFAVDLIASAEVRGGGGVVGAPLFWTLVGASGVAGAFAGDAVSRVRIKNAFVGAVLALAAATALLAVGPAFWPTVLASALFFGAAFIAVTGLLGLWSIDVFHERPSAGFGATFFLLSAGQLVGPSLFAVVSDLMGLPSAFYLAAALTVAAVVLAPRKNAGAADRDLALEK